jgi:hypothetical protein
MSTESQSLFCVLTFILTFQPTCFLSRCWRYVFLFSFRQNDSNSQTIIPFSVLYPIILTVDIDLFNRKVIAWSRSSDMFAANTPTAACRISVRNNAPYP